MDKTLKKEFKEKENKEELKLKEEIFEFFWVEYGRKGSKKVSKERFLKLKQEDIYNMIPHLKKYIEVNAKNPVYKKDFERYISHRLWEDNEITEPVTKIKRSSDGVYVEPIRNSDSYWGKVKRGEVEENDFDPYDFSKPFEK
ncbi:MAG: hypothetical protein LBV47_00870 [Bacteroidales bacterium]|jgi:hypothetical protein|nr:hypothetical protein [Bacteroidales bacterium]